MIRRAVATLTVPLALAAAPTAFAQSLRAPDFNGDRRADVAIGASWRQVGIKSGAGAVDVAYGDNSATGFAPAWSVNQQTPGVPLASETFGHFGDSLAWGDFNRDGYSDLAVGMPDATIGGASDAGAVYVFYGASQGLSGDRVIEYDLAQSWAGHSESGDRFGHSLAAGDFDGDGFDDLAIGAPGSYFGPPLGGAVFVLHGSGMGPLDRDDRYSFIFTDGWTASAAFGSALAAGDFDCDGSEELAIGDPDVMVAGEAAAGMVHIWDERSCPEGGWLCEPRQKWTQDSNNVPGMVESYDHFGSALVAGNFNNDTRNGRPCIDLAIGVPGEGIGSRALAGSVNVLYGGSSALSAANATDLQQDIEGVSGVAEELDQFGAALSVNRANNDSYDDLVVGIPGENDYVGYIAVFKGGSSGITVSGNVLWGQGVAGVPGTGYADDAFGSAVGGGAVGLIVVGAPGEYYSSMSDTGDTTFIRTLNSSSITASSTRVVHQSDFGGSNQDFDRIGSSITGARPALVR
jgi:hypothetical protein